MIQHVFFPLYSHLLTELVVFMQINYYYYYYYYYYQSCIIGLLTYYRSAPHFHLRIDPPRKFNQPPN